LLAGDGGQEGLAFVAAPPGGRIVGGQVRPAHPDEVVDELAMRRRQNRKLWNLTIHEFDGYVANEGSVKTLPTFFPRDASSA